MKTKAPKIKQRFSTPLLAILCLLILALMNGACSSSRRYKINLMPAPTVFEDGAIDPLPKGPPRRQSERLYGSQQINYGEF
jgi:hypothetical protein